MKPRYRHHCDHCVFLGHVTFPSPRLSAEREWTEMDRADLYVCMARPDDGPLGRTLIARFSSKDGNYASCSHILVRRHYFKNELSSASPAIIAAYWFAVAKRLIAHEEDPKRERA